MNGARIAAYVQGVEGLRLIGVDGPSGSGKSTLARDLAQRLEAPIVELDDFVSWDCFAGWWPRFEEQVLAPLLRGDDAVYQARDWAGDWPGSSLGSWKKLPWHPTVIIEGVTATRRAIADRLACAVWVDAPAEVRLARGLARDAGFPDAAARWERWMAEEERFFAADGARTRADFLFDTAGGWGLRPAVADDLEMLVELRAVVLRADLERLGRYDEHRVRQRLRNSFDPRYMSIIEVDGAAAGSITLRPDGVLEHFYLDPRHQKRGLGSAVLRQILARADAGGLTVRLDVLQGSPARRLYERHGFALESADPVDVILVRKRGDPGAAAAGRLREPAARPPQPPG